jgi:hypothetical protein
MISEGRPALSCVGFKLHSGRQPKVEARPVGLTLADPFAARASRAALWREEKIAAETGG